jgi:membrane-associated protein
LHGEGLKQLVLTGTYLVLFLIVFAETGLLVGFFLPGDSLLFVAGALAAANPTKLNIALLIVVVAIAAITGDATGYFIGRKVGPRLFNRPDSRLFKREYVTKTHAFYEKHGPKTIVLARFVPIVRTFAPTVAGVGEMSFRTFATYNIFGGIGWTASMLLAGYFLGSVPIIRDNFEKTVIGIVILSIMPMVVHFLQERKREGAGPAAVEAMTTLEMVDGPDGPLATPNSVEPSATVER